MGGVYAVTARANDALFYNPANLGFFSGINLEILGIGAGVNGLDAYNQIQEINQNGSSSVSQYIGGSYWLGANARISLVTPRFGFGASNNFDLSMRLQNPLLPTLSVSYLNDMTYVIGGSLPIQNNTYFGISLMQINRTGGAKDISAATLTNQSALQSLASQFTDAGQGYGADLAISHQIDGTITQTVTAVWENAGYTTFRPTNGITAPPLIAGNQTLGYSAGQDLPGLDWVVAFEMRYLNNNDNDLGKKIHMGAEISLPFIDLRAGLNQGYNTYGIGLDAIFAHFDLAYYDVEMGTYVGQTSQNRIAAALTFDIGFDANFNFTVSDYRKKRHLKQRR